MRFSQPSAVGGGTFYRPPRLSRTTVTGGLPVRFRYPLVSLALLACVCATALAASPRTLRFPKHLRFDKVLPIIEAFTRKNVFTSGFFMVGFPSETEEVLQGTIDFALSSKLHAAYFFVVTPFSYSESERGMKYQTKQ